MGKEIGGGSYTRGPSGVATNNPSVGKKPFDDFDPQKVTGVVVNRQVPNEGQSFTKDDTTLISDITRGVRKGEVEVVLGAN